MNNEAMSEVIGELEKYDLEMESIYMAWQCGANYPQDKLAEAILYIQSREMSEVIGE